MKTPAWTKQQLRTLRREYPRIDNPRNLEPLIGKPYSAIKSQASNLGLLREKHAVGLSQASKKELDFIRANYLTIPEKTMATALGRSDSFVRGRMKAMGLTVPREIVEQRKIDSQIKKGSVPPNKGKKQAEYMTAETIERTKATRFQKGQIPHNAIGFKNGDVSIRADKRGVKYKHIRISRGKWQELQRYNWEKKYGPIAKGMVLRSKNGDQLNCKPSNWMLITKADNARLNVNHENPSDSRVASYLAGRGKKHLVEAFLEQPELLDIKRKQLLLKRTINERKSN
jgi:hypothetical protein